MIFIFTRRAGRAGSRPRPSCDAAPPRWGTALVVLLLATALLASRAAWAGEPPEVVAQRVVHILDYVAADYALSVEGGRIVNQDEYDEQLALLAEADRLAAALPPPTAGGAPLPLSASLAALRARVQGRADAGEVAAAAAALRASVFTAYRLVGAPDRVPSETAGRVLYVKHCAECHGATGRGDTEKGRALRPPAADFHDPAIAPGLSPYRAASTIRFGVRGTAMVPFETLSDADRWDLAFYVVGLRHDDAGAPVTAAAPAYTLAELATASDAELLLDMEQAGIPPGDHPALLATLRRRAPYRAEPPGAPLAVARARLDVVATSYVRGDTARARGALVDAYLSGVELVEGALVASDGALVRTLEARFRDLRAAIERGAPPREVEEGVAALRRDVSRAEAALAAGGGRSFGATFLASAGILLREGVEAALLLAALLGVLARAGLGERRRLVHVGWVAALVAGAATWWIASRVLAVSGAAREKIEGGVSLLASAVLFYVSYSLIAQHEVARWLRFVREQAGRSRGALALVGVSFLAAYREAFETVLFFQALLLRGASAAAALLGALSGAAALVALVALYRRAGRLAPPRVFFKASSALLYTLAVVFAGQGIAALQLAGVVPLTPLDLPVPAVPALGFHLTLETMALQGVLVAAAVFAAIYAAGRPAPEGGAPPTPQPTGGP